MSFILDALKKVDRKTDAQTEDGIVMQGGRVWGGSHSARGWVWGAVLVLALVTFGLAGLALFRSFQETREFGAAASAPRGVSPSLPSSSGETLASISNGANGAENKTAASRKTYREPSPAASSSGVIEPSATLPETGLVEADILAELLPPVRLVGRGAAERADAPPDSEAVAEPPADLPPLALQGTSVIDGKPVAVVNYQRVFEGDIIEGARIIKILDRAVELEFKGSRFTIRL